MSRENVSTSLLAQAVGTLNLEIDLSMMHRLIPILIHHFVYDISTRLPSACDSFAKAPFNSCAWRQIDMTSSAQEKSFEWG